MDVQASAPLLSQPAPDWAAVSDEISCPLCEYNLRGLTLPRCPECGYHFAWAEVLDTARRKHRYIFEHHVRSPVWSFWRTLWAGWRPRRFWSELNAAQRVYPVRLLAYWIVVILPCLAALFLLSLMTNRMQVLPALKAMFDDDDFSVLWAGLVWPWLIFASLLVFRWSMRRARISNRHVLRCVVYTHDTLFWVGLMMLASLALFTDGFRRGWADEVLAAWACLLFAGYLIAMFKLYRAYRLYMRFEHVGPMVISVAVMALLAWANLMLMVFL